MASSGGRKQVSTFAIFQGKTDQTDPELWSLTADGIRWETHLETRWFWLHCIWPTRFLFLSEIFLTLLFRFVGYCGASNDRVWFVDRATFVIQIRLLRNYWVRHHCSVSLRKTSLSQWCCSDILVEQQSQQSVRFIGNPEFPRGRQLGSYRQFDQIFLP